MKEILCNITQQDEGRTVVVHGLTEPFVKDNVLGIINKTQSKVLYTPVQAANMLSAIYQDGTLTISLASNVPSINARDELLIKLYLDQDRDIAKQGENQEATNSKILEETLKLSDIQPMIDELLAIQLETIIGKEDEYTE